MIIKSTEWLNKDMQFYQTDPQQDLFFIENSFNKSLNDVKVYTHFKNVNYQSF